MRSDKLNPNSNAFNEGWAKGTLGSYFGLSVGAPSVSSNACTLVVNQVNSPTYTGAAALAATLPPATAGAVCVFSMAEDPAGGTNALTFDCAGSDKWETGCVVPTTSSNKITYDVSAADETNLVFTPTNDTVNFLSFGSAIEFVCERDGYWYVNVTKLNSDIGVTAGAATGTLLFAS
jgi:hypothetical protein